MSTPPKEPKSEYYTFGISKSASGYAVVRTKMRGKQVIEVENLLENVEKIDAKTQLRVQVNRFLFGYDQ